MFPFIVYVPMLINGTQFEVAIAEISVMANMIITVYLYSVPLKEEDIYLVNGCFYHEMEEAEQQEDSLKLQYDSLSKDNIEDYCGKSMRMQRDVLTLRKYSGE